MSTSIVHRYRNLVADSTPDEPLNRYIAQSFSRQPGDRPRADQMAQAIQEWRQNPPLGIVTK